METMKKFRTITMFRKYAEFHGFNLKPGFLAFTDGNKLLLSSGWSQPSGYCDDDNFIYCYHHDDDNGWVGDWLPWGWFEDDINHLLEEANYIRACFEATKHARDELYRTHQKVFTIPGDSDAKKYFNTGTVGVYYYVSTGDEYDEGYTVLTKEYVDDIVESHQRKEKEYAEACINASVFEETILDENGLFIIDDGNIIYYEDDGYVDYSIIYSLMERNGGFITYIPTDKPGVYLAVLESCCTFEYRKLHSDFDNHYVIIISDDYGNIIIMNHRGETIKTE